MQELYLRTLVSYLSIYLKVFGVLPLQRHPSPLSGRGPTKMRPRATEHAWGRPSTPEGEWATEHARGRPRSSIRVTEGIRDLKEPLFDTVNYYLLKFYW